MNHAFFETFRSEPWSSVVHYLSGESMLNNQPNGGNVIFLRAVFVAAWTFAVALVLYNIFDPNRTCVFRWSRECVFNFEEMLDQIVKNFGWFVTVFAAAYVALYARFASQWTYLANLYNNINYADARTAHDWSHRKRLEAMASWKAAFLEDADTLHLATKGLFVAAVKRWGEDQAVKEQFIKNTYRGEQRFTKLMKNVEDSYKRHEDKYRLRGL